MNRFYGLKNCDTCKKALKALEAAGVAVENVDVRADGVPGDVLAGWLEELGPELLVNRRSTTWRGLDPDAETSAMTAEGAAAEIAENPTLMKRPVIVAGGEVHVGWSANVEAEVISS